MKDKKAGCDACLFRLPLDYLFLGPGTRGPKLALSTFYRAHRSYRFLLITADDHEICFLDSA